MASLWNAEMLLTEAEIGRNHISWQRISDDVQGDIAWNIQHATGTQGLRLDVDSTVDYPWVWQVGAQISFRCDIFIPEQNETYSSEYSVTI